MNSSNNFDFFIKKVEKKYNISSNKKLLEISFLKIWIEFEKIFLICFENYCLGKKTEKNYKPVNRLKFQDNDHLYKTLFKNRHYFKIEDLKYYSVYILEEKKDPFKKIFNSSNLLIRECINIRNHIVHNSDKTTNEYNKILKKYNKNTNLDVSDFLLEFKEKKTYYTHYIDNLKNIIKILQEPTNYF